MYSTSEADKILHVGTNLRRNSVKRVQTFVSTVVVFVIAAAAAAGKNDYTKRKIL